MFIVCGEALMDVFEAGDTASGMALDARVGGSPFNTAVGLARLGQPVGLLASISRGFLGERLMKGLRAEGVDTSTVQRSDAATTLGLVGLDRAGVPSYSFYGEGCADRQLGTDALQWLPRDMAAIHLGSYATVVEPIGSTLRALVEREHARTLISYDPNVRLNVEPDLARWRAMLDWMLTRTQILKISDEDLALLRPDASADDFASECLRHGVRLLVVTRGARGACAWTPRARAEVTTVVVNVVDTVGAGDTFQAALLTWLAEHERLSPAALAALSTADLASALDFAARAAAITCSRRGADMPRRNELDQAPPP